MFSPNHDASAIERRRAAADAAIRDAEACLAREQAKIERTVAGGTPRVFADRAPLQLAEEALAAARTERRAAMLAKRESAREAERRRLAGLAPDLIDAASIAFEAAREARDQLLRLRGLLGHAGPDEIAELATPEVRRAITAAWAAAALVTAPSVCGDL